MYIDRWEMYIYNFTSVNVGKYTWSICVYSGQADGLKPVHEESPEERRQALKVTPTPLNSTIKILQPYFSLHVEMAGCQERAPLLPGAPKMDASLEELVFEFKP